MQQTLEGNEDFPRFTQLFFGLQFVRSIYATRSLELLLKNIYIEETNSQSETTISLNLGNTLLIHEKGFSIQGNVIAIYFEFFEKPAFVGLLRFQISNQKTN